MTADHEHILSRTVMDVTVLEDSTVDVIGLDAVVG